MGRAKDARTLAFFEEVVSELEDQSKAGVRTQVHYTFNVPKGGFKINIQLISAPRLSPLDPPQITFVTSVDVEAASSAEGMATPAQLIPLFRAELMMAWQAVYFNLLQGLEYGTMPSAHAVELRHIVDLVTLQGYEALKFSVLRPHKGRSKYA